MDLKRQNNQGRWRVLLLMLTDLFGISLICVGSLFFYQQLGGAYSMSVCWSLWPLPLIIVVFYAFSRLYCGSVFYPGAGVNPVEELKRIVLGVDRRICFAFYLFCFDADNGTLFPVRALVGVCRLYFAHPDIPVSNPGVYASFPLV